MYDSEVTEPAIDGERCTNCNLLVCNDDAPGCECVWITAAIRPTTFARRLYFTGLIWLHGGIEIWNDGTITPGSTKRWWLTYEGWAGFYHAFVAAWISRQ